MKLLEKFLKETAPCQLMPNIKEIRMRGKKEYTSLHRKLLHEISFYLTKIFIHLPLTPNQITIFWMIWQFASCFILLKGTYGSILLGTFLFQFGTFLDCVDGQVARYRKTSSLLGVYLDQFAHNILNPLFLLFLGLGVAKQQNNIYYFYVSIMGATSFLFTRVLAMNVLWFRPEYTSLVLKYFDNYSMRKRWVAIYDSLKIEYPFNLLFFGILFGFANIMVILYTVLYFLDLVKRTIFQFVKMRAVDKELGPGAKGGLG